MFGSRARHYVRRQGPALCSAAGPGIKMPVYSEKVFPTLETKRAYSEGGGKPRPYGYGKKYPSHGVTFSSRPAF